ncbi:PAS domain S-box protein [Lysobacter sp. HDW10]|uniref:GGDEF domain-containing protein n=1 Tax=Lysobacter sp. HDW10 TaxID=2714936 RepID=UPI0014093132|nr:GGDEF domain-containing protein [Lysobacter sp. HDW10]QIK81001.1 PAS domain S-box protein [Lysobacter sp. HDW10]
MRDQVRTKAAQAPIDTALLLCAFDAPDFPLGCVQLDRQFHIVSVTAAALRDIGGTTEDALGHALKQWRYLRLEFAVKLMDALTCLSEANQTSTVFTEDAEIERCLRWTVVRCEGANPADDQTPAYLLIVGQVPYTGNRDGAQRRLQEVMRDLFEQSPLGEAYVSIEGEFLKSNQSLCNMLGYTEGELRNLDFQQITHPEDLSRDLMKVTDMLDNRIRSYHIEKRYIRKNGEIMWGHLYVSAHRDEHGKVTHFVVLIEDVTPRKHLEQKFEGEVAKLQDQLLMRQQEVTALHARLDRLALVDPITGLLNKQGLDIELARAFLLASEDAEPYAVIDLRFEGFEAFANAQSVDATNKLLRLIGESLHHLVRRSDVVGRRAQDNFVVALGQRAVLGVGVEEIARRIGNAMTKDYDIDGESVPLKVELGMSERQEGDSLEDMLARAQVMPA